MKTLKQAVSQLNKLQKEAHRQAATLEQALELLAGKPARKVTKGMSVIGIRRVA